MPRVHVHAREGLALSTPAPIVETLELVAATKGGGLKPWMRRGLTLQVLRSLSFAWRERETGRLVAAGGFYPLPPAEPGEEHAETWFLCRPDLGGNMLEFVRLARLTHRRAAEYGPVRLSATVREGHRPGQRLARLLAYRRLDVVNGYELWEWRSERICPDDLRGHVAERAPGG